MADSERGNNYYLTTALDGSTGVACSMGEHDVDAQYWVEGERVPITKTCGWRRILHNLPGAGERGTFIIFCDRPGTLTDEDGQFLRCALQNRRWFPEQAESDNMGNSE